MYIGFQESSVVQLFLFQIMMIIHHAIDGVFRTKSLGGGVMMSLHVLICQMQKNYSYQAMDKTV